MLTTHRPKPRPDQLSLSPSELHTLTPTQPTTLHLRSGVLWVTQAGDDHDYFLKAGQSMLLAPHRVTVMQAESASVQASLAAATKHSQKRRYWNGLRKFLGVGLQFST